LIPENNPKRNEEGRNYKYSATPKVIGKFDEVPLSSQRNPNPISSQEKTRTNILANQGQNSIINIGHPINYNHNSGVLGNKSMAECNHTTYLK